MSVFLHVGQPPYVTHDIDLIGAVQARYGAHSSVLVMANDLGQVLRGAPIGGALVSAEEPSMVRLEFA